MKKILLVLGFLFSWISPFIVIYLNHIVAVEATTEVDLFGLLLALAFIIGFIKWVDNKCKVWEIQDRYKLFRVNWSNGKKIIIAIGLTWILHTVEDDLPKIQWSAVLITISMCIGYVLTLLGNIKKRVAH